MKNKSYLIARRSTLQAARLYKTMNELTWVIRRQKEGYMLKDS